MEERVRFVFNLLDVTESGFIYKDPTFNFFRAVGDSDPDKSMGSCFPNGSVRASLEEFKDFVFMQGSNARSLLLHWASQSLPQMGGSRRRIKSDGRFVGEALATHFSSLEMEQLQLRFQVLVMSSPSGQVLAFALNLPF